MRNLLGSTLITLILLPAQAQAQQALDQLRFEWLSGYFSVGTLADADFIFDASGFGGLVVQRSEGVMDVDPSLSHGIRTTYRLGPRYSVAASYLRSRGRYRVEFPANASIEGNFDLEGLLLATFDFAFGSGGIASGSRPASAMSDAVTDIYLASAELEFPRLDGWVYPFITVGGGMLWQKSAGSVFHMEFEGEVPEAVQAVENQGMNFLETGGLSIFSTDDSSPVAMFGGGVRASISERWGLRAEFQDLVRFGVDMTYIDQFSTPPPDVNIGRVYSTTFRGRKGTVHNFNVSLAVSYALWPWSTPR